MKYVLVESRSRWFETQVRVRAMNARNRRFFFSCALASCTTGVLGLVDTSSIDVIQTRGHGMQIPRTRTCFVTFSGRF